jgi:phosphatidylserine/phosphatidylglycerophosphate/cardiolipin synthase-like enzyme
MQLDGDTELPVWLKRCVAFVLIASTLVLGGCALPPHPELPYASASDHWAATPLGQITQSRLLDDNRSGFKVLPVASYAFATRIELTRRAVETIDVQYYIFSNDDTGRALLKALAAAARRGVRVRMLLDDLYETGEDALLSDFASIPNVEVRLFNPFAGGRDIGWTRLLGAGLSFDVTRIDRRMHNKLFIVDNAAAMAGGRNIANEYFMHDGTSNFVDLDLFVAGPAVRQLSGAFDLFWNSREVFPLGSVVQKNPNVTPSAAEFDRLVKDAEGPPPDDLPPEFSRFGSLPGEIASGQLQPLTLGRATVVADDPAKAELYGHEKMSTVSEAVLAKLAGVKDSVIIVSPYFVPGERGMRMIREAKISPGTTRVFTNSLASTDEPIAEHGYMKYRKALLENNVALYELSPSLVRDRNRMGAFGKSAGSLHVKCVVFDNETVFLGSLNLDHRSAAENTEVGILIDSPEMAGQLTGLLDVDSFYQLSLDSSNQVQWTAQLADGPHIYHEDPETTAWQRLVPAILGPFVPEDQL